MDCNIITNRDNTDKMWNMLSYAISSVQFSRSVVSDSWRRQASLSITNSQISPKFLVHGVGDAIQPSHPLSSPSPPAFNPSQHQGLFKCHPCFLTPPVGPHLYLFPLQA